MHAEIANLQRCVVRQGILHVQVPLFGVRVAIRAKEGIKHSNANIRIRPSGNSFGKIESCWRWVAESSAVGAGTGRRLLARVGRIKIRVGREPFDTWSAVRAGGLKRGGSINNTESRPNNKIWERVVSKSYTRTKILPLRWAFCPAVLAALNSDEKHLSC